MDDVLLGIGELMKKHRLATASRCWLICIAMAPAGVGCQAHANASAHVDSSGEVKAEGHATVEVSGKAEGSDKIKLGDLITLEGDQLKYSGGPIDFEYDSIALKLDASESGAHNKEVLSELHKLLEEHKEVKVSIEGHADSRGEATKEGHKHNIELSDGRAGSVKKWLVGKGIAEARLTSKGFGYHPETDEEKEPSECFAKTGSDKQFADKKGCIAAWDVSRHTRFRITEGLETLRPRPTPVEKEPDKAPPAPEPALEPKGCRWLNGFHTNLGMHFGGGDPQPVIGPIAFATQPICPLELSLGVAYKWGNLKRTNETQGGSYNGWLVPLDARIWFLRTHSPLLSAGLGLAHYSASSHNTGTEATERNATFDVFYGRLGAGYGYRSNGPFRAAILLGGVFHPVEIDPFSSISSPKFFVEASCGWLF